MNTFPNTCRKLIGKQGEYRAADWLKASGYSIQVCNWRYRRYELDIIASKEAVLHFIEVKTATTDQFGLPEQRVNKNKFSHILCD